MVLARREEPFGTVAEKLDAQPLPFERVEQILSFDKGFDIFPVVVRLS